MPFDEERRGGGKNCYSVYCACCHRLRTRKGVWVYEFASEEDLQNGGRLFGLGAVPCPSCRPKTT